MKRFFLFFLTGLFLNGSLFAADVDDINWAADYDTALQEAQKTGQNIFLLITAPSWCYWCQQLEKNVFTDEDVIKYINNNFIAVRILDSDEDVDRFDFDGYPTVWVLDSGGSVLEDVYRQDPDAVLKLLKPYAGSGTGQYSQTDYSSPPDVAWETVEDVAQYKGGDWNNYLYTVEGVTVEEALAIAEEDSDVSFFFYVKGRRLVLEEKGSFNHGDAVFFYGDPWWGSAPGLADGYIKTAGK